MENGTLSTVLLVLVILGQLMGCCVLVWLVGLCTSRCWRRLRGCRQESGTADGREP